MSKLTSLTWRSGYELDPRPGIFGKWLDRTKPRYKFVGGYTGWVAPIVMAKWPIQPI